MLNFWRCRVGINPDRLFIKKGLQSAPFSLLPVPIIRMGTKYHKAVGHSEAAAYR
jgi:hypothetical protein